jgi:hypothetical protein
MRSDLVKTFGLQGYVFLDDDLPLHASSRLDLGPFIVDIVEFLFSVLQTLQWYQSRIYA